MTPFLEQVDLIEGQVRKALKEGVVEQKWYFPKNLTVHPLVTATVMEIFEKEGYRVTREEAKDDNSTDCLVFKVGYKKSGYLF